MGLDRLDYANTAAKSHEGLTPKAKRFLEELTSATEVPVEFIGTGFGTFDVIPVPVPTAPTVLTHA